MINQILTLFKGVATDKSEEFTDRHALLLLKQRIRDSAKAIETSRKAVAIAIAQNEQEVIQHSKLDKKITELETRTVEAMEQNKKTLALEAAEMIAVLEAERDTSALAQCEFTKEIERLKNIVRKAESRLKELQRGQRLATAVNHTQKLRNTHPGSNISDLKDAEETLQRLRVRQQQIDTAAQAIDEMDSYSDPVAMTQKLAEAGCGAPIKSSGQDVIDRLNMQMKKSV